MPRAMSSPRANVITQSLIGSPMLKARAPLVLDLPRTPGSTSS
jgi:hypothetical protein